MPFAFVLLIVAGNWQTPRELLQPGWLFTCVGLTALSIFLWLLFAREQVSIHSEGIAHNGIFGGKEIRWEDVKETRYSQISNAQVVGQHFGLLGAVIGMFVGRKQGSSQAVQSLTIVSTGGPKVTISNSYADYKELMKMVLARINGRLLPEYRSRLKQGMLVEFGKLELSMQGVTWKGKGPAAYGDINASLQGQYLKIKAQGKWLDFVSVPCAKLPSVFVALDLIQEMKTGSQAGSSGPLSFAATV